LVTRTEKYESVELFDGRGRVWSGTVLELGKYQVAIRIIGERTVPPPMELILGLALIRASAFEEALEKAVEAGVSRIIPFQASRSNVSQAPRPDRLQRIIIESAKQSKHFHLPTLDPPASFDAILQMAAASKILFSERDGGSLKQALAGAPTLYLIGPEGGWTDEELSAADSAGFHRVTLGRGILRAETAAAVGAALIHYELGYQ
jgi:16S rRNA (uracil1498-N3)-methyltransferase